MTRGRRIGSAAAVAAVAAALAAPAAAPAATRTFHDGADVPGKLDIRTVTQGRTRSGGVVHTIRTAARWRTRTLNLSTPNFFAVAIDTRGDRRPDRLVAVIALRGHLRGLVFDRGGDRIGSARVSRPDRRSVRVALGRSLLGRNVAGYRWRAVSVFVGRTTCRPGCVDQAPRGGALHDITPPEVRFPRPPLQITTAPTLRFSTSDAVSGVARWRVLERPAGGEWTVAREGSVQGSRQVVVHGEEGTTVD